MRPFTRDTDEKPDTPLSVWVGLAFIGLAVLMKENSVGPGELGLGWEMGLHTFFILVGLTALVPGLFLTLFRRPE